MSIRFGLKIGCDTECHNWILRPIPIGKGAFHLAILVGEVLG
jgi:hypothetical protein